MAILVNEQTGEKVHILAQHVFGRHPDTNNTVLKNSDASRMHAMMLWEDDRWVIKDLSTNGTFVNNKKLTKEAPYSLSCGDKIKFGNLKSDTWCLSDEGEPRCMLIPLSEGEESIELDNILALPSEDKPEVTLYASHTGTWVCESPSGVSVLRSGDVIRADMKNWRFVDAQASAKTTTHESARLMLSSEVGFKFNVSQNEEHVSLTLTLGDDSHELGERSHHYLMLILARKRLEDAQAGLDEKERGWIEKEKLCSMLGLSEHHINIQIYRFRKQFVNVLPKSLVLHQAIERRRGYIRFVYDNVDVVGGNWDVQIPAKVFKI